MENVTSNNYSTLYFNRIKFDVLGELPLFSVFDEEMKMMMSYDLFNINT